ncbi:MAG: type II toxin-antitoxin system RelE/ParE family toxin [Gammaproteobacteria bacterium]|nr:type II toxin-antitoxin system RelE/ParE family toxin [Gammaproteobacteria bacterium]
MASLIWTGEAEHWLKDIYDFIAKDNETAATNVVTGIYDKAQVLLDHPEIGYKYEHESEEDIRILLYGHYRIAYVLKKNQDIVVLGVFHGSLQIENYLIN